MRMKYIKKITRSFYWAFLLILVFMCSSCKKYLDAKPDPTKVEPTNLEDMQALLDDVNVMNYNSPGLLLLVADEYYLPSTVYDSREIDERNNYVWAPDATDITAWEYPYQPVYSANVVLAELAKVARDNKNEI